MYIQCKTAYKNINTCNPKVGLIDLTSIAVSHHLKFFEHLHLRFTSIQNILISIK